MLKIKYTLNIFQKINYIIVSYKKYIVTFKNYIHIIFLIKNIKFLFKFVPLKNIECYIS